MLDILDSSGHIKEVSMKKHRYHRLVILSSMVCIIFIVLIISLGCSNDVTTSLSSKTGSNSVEIIKDGPSRNITEEIVIDIDGNEYQAVEIGEQVWMERNLNVSTFSNGDPIPETLTSGNWSLAGEASEPVWAFYDNRQSNGETYGKLYNWYAINDPRGLAPKGWHIPTDAEWDVLINYLGGKKSAGGKMKVSDNGDNDYWGESNKNATNSSGFSALPGGYRLGGSSDEFIGEHAYFASSGAGGSSYCFLGSGSGAMMLGASHNEIGLSVRCIRD